METWMCKSPPNPKNGVVFDYKKRLGLKASDISENKWSDDAITTVKYDGELNIAFLENGEVIFANRYYRLRKNMPVGDEIAEKFAKHGVIDAVIVGELYAVGENESKLSLGEVMHRIKKPSNQEEEESVRFAAFDILEINNKKLESDYGDRLHWLHATLKTGKAHVAEYNYGATGAYHLWDKVIENGWEGLIIRCPEIGNRKVKQKFDIDLVVVGITTKGKSWDRGEAPALVLAFMDEDGIYRYAGTAGGGLRPGEILGKGGNKEQYRAWWFNQAHEEDLGIKQIGSKTVKMMRPKHVVTIRADDWVVDERPTLLFGEDWQIRGENEISAVGQKPRVSSYRFDKSNEDVSQHDIRLEQIPEMVV